MRQDKKKRALSDPFRQLSPCRVFGARPGLSPASTGTQTPIGVSELPPECVDNGVRLVAE